MQTEVIFSFDTEDFTSPRNADAVLELAKLFAEEGITAHFGVVGLVAKRFLDDKRYDVIDALRPHILGFHSCRHTVHPTMAEMCDIEDTAKASAELEAVESEGLELLRRTFGDKPIRFAVPPGMDVTYHAQYFYSRKGIPFYFGGFINDSENSLMDYCGMVQLPYTVGLEQMFLGQDRPDLDQLLEQLHHNRRIIIYHHPNLAVKTVFWDQLNYNQRNLREFGDWVDAPDRPAEETKQFFSDIRSFLCKLKQDPRFAITDIEKLLAERQTRLAKPIVPSMLPALVRELEPELTPLKSSAYSVADVFCAAASFLQGKDSYTPDLNKGFLYAPCGIEKETSVSAASVRAEAKKIVAGDFIPSVFKIDGQRIGPGDMLFAMAEAVAGENDTIRLKPRRQTVDVSGLKELSKLDLKGGWLFSSELEDKYLSDRLRLQAWTWRKYGI